MKGAILTFLAAMVAWQASAGPFGYEMGQQMEGEPDGVADGGQSYQTMPNPPHPFDGVAAYYTKQTGVCQLMALMKLNVSTDAAGVDHRRTADRLVDQLRVKYGEPTNSFDFIIRGALWDAPGEWLMAIRQNERTYAYYWAEEQNGEMVYPDEIEEIQVKVYYGGVQLTYHFTNASECLADGNDRLRDVL